jgi:hypothetical protein
MTVTFYRKKRLLSLIGKQTATRGVITVNFKLLKLHSFFVQYNLDSAKGWEWWYGCARVTDEGGFVQ